MTWSEPAPDPPEARYYSPTIGGARWGDLLSAYTRHAIRIGLRPSTVHVHVAHCRDLARRSGRRPGQVTAEDIATWLARPTWSYTTRKQHRASAAAVYAWAVQARIFEHDPTAGVVAHHPSTVDTLERDRTRGLVQAVAEGVDIEHPARRWARITGLPVPESGRLPVDILSAWLAAGCPHPGVTGADALAEWSQLLDQFATADRAAGNRPQTTVLRRRHLEQFAAATGARPAEVTHAELLDWLGNSEWAPATRYSHRSSLRRVLGWAHEAGHLPTNPAAALPRVRVPAGVPRPAAETAIRDAINAATPKVRLMLQLAALQGLRRAEIARLRLEDITGDGIHVTGKGGAERLVPVHPALRLELAAYIDQAAITQGWLFPDPTGATHLSIRHVGRAMSRLLPPGVSAHKLRHRFASKAYAAAYDLRSVQELLGHASPAVTARYVAVPLPQLEAAVMAVPPVPGIVPPTRRASSSCSSSCSSSSCCSGHDPAAGQGPGFVSG